MMFLLETLIARRDGSSRRGVESILSCYFVCASSFLNDPDVWLLRLRRGLASFVPGDFPVVY